MLSDWLHSLSGPYQDPKDWMKYGPIQKRDIFRFVQLWLSEGIPFAFSECPAVYAVSREAFSRVAECHPNQLRVTGSGMLGYSLATDKFGRQYDSTSSDVDLYLVDAVSFEKLKREADLFVSRYNASLAVPSGAKEDRIWSENTTLLGKNAARGFLNSNYIPSREMYPFTRKLAAACERFRCCANEASGRKIVTKASVRVYRDWEAVQSQIGGSLLKALKATGHEVGTPVTNA